MTERKAKYTPLKLLKPGPSGEDTVVTQQKTRHNADSVLGQIVMHSAMAWIAACLEEKGKSVEVAQIGPGIFDATVFLATGAAQMLRVNVHLELGPKLSTRVEPLHP
jgi:hypothetical protein